MGQLMALAYIGSSIQSISDEVSNSIYNINWMGADGNCKKNILISMLSQPVTIKVGGIFDITLPNFLFVSNKFQFLIETFLKTLSYQQVTKSAYSMFNLIRSVRKS